MSCENIAVSEYEDQEFNLLEKRLNKETGIDLLRAEISNCVERDSDFYQKLMSIVDRFESGESGN